VGTPADLRSWNDVQLREAVAGSRSWRAVARALELKGTSAGVIRTLKRHADRLELPSSVLAGRVPIEVAGYAAYQEGDASSLLQ
jgi:hypothetical protein